MESLWEIILVFLLSTVKFVFGSVPLALGFGFSFFEAVTVTSLGGFTGAIFFVFMSDKILSFFKKRKARKKLENPDTPHKKVFTNRNRMIVRVKKRFGLLGIAFLSPFLFPLPLGCFLAVRYFKNKQKILIYMFGAILFWSVTVSSLKLLF
ncbi:MAG: hypothetical protein A3F72_04470 [Bacteroidetes bacterium RIFCSPLOWO2_12_FULL_35_15]|nr:MAG: hypothetical protein A3F72_04470 [Bacteroidetes bacterium RIFCSPLOWO2_12_FULL_35_15]